MTSTEQGARVRFPPPLVFGLAILVGVGLGYLAGPARAPIGDALRLLASGVILACAVGLIASALGRFRRSGQSPTPWSPSPSLILTGPYRFTRNPMYVAMTLLQIGLGLAFDNLWIALLAAPALAVIHLVAVRPEETYLAARFGQSYAEYCARVRRYL